MNNKSASGTISASATTVGPVEVSPNEALVYTVDYSSGTITLQFATAEAGPFVAVEDGYTADTAKQATGPGWYQLVGTSTPSADVSMLVR